MVLPLTAEMGIEKVWQLFIAFQNKAFSTGFCFCSNACAHVTLINFF